MDDGSRPSLQTWTQDIGQLPESTPYAVWRDHDGDDDDGMIIFVWEMCPSLITQDPHNRWY